jgi:hypothetical protein
MIKKRHSLQELRAMAPSQLRQIIKDQQAELLKLHEEHNILLSATQGYLLGISQLKGHISRVLKRTKQIQEMHAGDMIL